MSHETEHKVTTPQDKSAHEIREHFNEKENPRSAKWGRGKQVGVAATILTALAVGSGITMNALSGETKETPEPGTQPTVEAPVVPGENPTQPVETETPAPIETEPTTSIDLEPIPADASPEEIAQASTDMWNDWVFTGATEDTVVETNNSWFAYEGEYESFLQETANKNAEPFVETYFAPDWENNQALVRYYDVTVGANKNYLEVALHRINNDKPLISVSTEVSNVFEVPAPEGQRIIQYNISGEFTNSEVEYRGGLIKDIFDISDGTARLVGTETVIE